MDKTTCHDGHSMRPSISQPSYFCTFMFAECGLVMWGIRAAGGHGKVGRTGRGWGNAPSCPGKIVR
jgi:hypothetical protein